MKIAILGGSGKLGKGLAARLSHHDLIIGSRDPAKGLPYREAAAACEIAIISTPYSAHAEVLSAIRNDVAGKIVIDATVPLDPTDLTQVRTTSGRSAAEETAATVPEARVFAAFQTVSHLVLIKPGATADVLIAGDAEGKEAVMELVSSMSLRPIYAGPLQAAAAAIERLTALLICINKANRVRQATIRIEGV